MELYVQNLSFYVIQTDGPEQDAPKRFKHYQTLDRESYEDSEIKAFLDDEFGRIVKRKAQKNPTTDNAPTKVGRFHVEPGHEPTANPNFNLFQRLRAAAENEEFRAAGEDMVRMYMDTSAVRGGAFIIARARLPRLFDDPFLFVLKCDFENKIARISDEKSLISRVEMAISARNIKSIQYPHMPEEGMLEEWELKIHQASHARYFEDFLKYVEYEKTKPEILHEQMMGMVQQYIETKWEDDGPGGEEKQRLEERQREEEQFEIWAAGEKRQLQEKWTHEHVMEAASYIVEQMPDLDMRVKLDGVSVHGKMSDYGSRFHIARLDGRYAIIVTGDAFQFDKGMSPVELLQPEEIEEVLRKIRSNPDGHGRNEGAQRNGSEREKPGDRQIEPNDGGTGDDVPW